MVRIKCGIKFTETTVYLLNKMHQTIQDKLCFKSFLSILLTKNTKNN